MNKTYFPKEKREQNLAENKNFQQDAPVDAVKDVLFDITASVDAIR